MSPAHAEPGNAVAGHPSAALRGSEKQAWPEWARAGESTGSELELRRTAVEDGGSLTVIGWSLWHRRLRTQSPGVKAPPGVLTVVAIAACTSIIVSLATVWLWGRLSVIAPPADTAPPVPVGDTGSKARLGDTAPNVTLADRPPTPELGPALLLAQSIASPLALAPFIAPIRPDVPLLAFLAPAARTRIVAPRPTVAARSDFVVTSDPAGANVTINGVGYGQTPVTIPFLPPGPRRIRVTKAGYRSQEQVVGAEVAGSMPGVRIVLAELSGAGGSTDQR